MSEANEGPSYPICPRCRSGRHSQHQYDFKTFLGKVELCKCPVCSVNTRTWVRNPPSFGSPSSYFQPWHWYSDGIVDRPKGAAKCGAVPEIGQQWAEHLTTKKPRDICQQCIIVKRAHDEQFFSLGGYENWEAERTTTNPSNTTLPLIAEPQTPIMSKPRNDYHDREPIWQEQVRKENPLPVETEDKIDEAMAKDYYR